MLCSDDTETGCQLCAGAAAARMTCDGLIDAADWHVERPDKPNIQPRNNVTLMRHKRVSPTAALDI